MPHGAVAGQRGFGERADRGHCRIVVAVAAAKTAEARGGRRQHVEVAVGQPSGQCPPHVGAAGEVGRTVAQAPRRHQPQVGRGIGCRRDERRGRRGVAVAQRLGQPLRRMHPGERRTRRVGEHDREAVAFAAPHQFPLGLEPDAAVGMAQECDEPLGIKHGPVATEQPADLGDGRGVLRGAGPGQEPPQASLAGAVPALHPVAHPDGAVGADLDVGGQHAGDRLLRVGDGEGSAAGHDAKRADAAVRGAALEIRQQETAGEVGREARAGIGGEPRGPGSHVSHGRQAEGRLAVRLRVPDLLAVPGAAIGEVLILHPPAGVGAVEQVHQPRPVAAVGVVVDREQVAEVVEGELLRIPQAGRHDLEPRAVGLAAEHRAAAGIRVEAAVVRDVIAAVADREVEAAVGAEGQAVEVVSAEGDADAVAGGEHRPLLRRAVDGAVAVEIPEPVEAGDARQPDVAPPREDAGGRAVFEPVETGGEHLGSVGPAVAVGVDEPADAVLVPFVVARLRAQEPPVIGDAIGDGAGRQVGLDPGAVVAAVVGDAAILAERLADVGGAPLVHGKRDGIAHVGFGGEPLDDEAGGHAEGGRGTGRLVRGGGWRGRRRSPVARHTRRS